MAEVIELRDPEVKTFADLMDTIEIPLPNTQGQFKDSCRYFQSTVRPFRPIVAPGVFGGHVLAQSAVVGAKTVGEKYIIHNVHGYFILPGKQDVPFTYRVETIRNGRSYSVRQIRVYQPDPEKGRIADYKFPDRDMCFMSICSFKRPEPASISHAMTLDPVLQPQNLAHPVEKVPLAPDVDVRVWQEYVAQQESARFVQEVHPIEVRKMVMDEYNQRIENVTNRRQIHYLRSHDRLPDDMNLHVAALLYASDRNSLFTVINLQDDRDELTIQLIASIDHAFIMHDLSTRVDEGWMTMETFTEHAGDGRALYNGRMFDKDNRHVCSFMQDGVMRVRRDQVEKDSKEKMSKL